MGSSLPRRAITSTSRNSKDWSTRSYTFLVQNMVQGSAYNSAAYCMLCATKTQSPTAVYSTASLSPTPPMMSGAEWIPMWAYNSLECNMLYKCLVLSLRAARQDWYSCANSVLWEDSRMSPSPKTEVHAAPEILSTMPLPSPTITRTAA
eukprot:CAMPEP_0196573586 /NCGR_PEP_ID=MMETSP1081-20130531/3468_1 /TAXON_ID=36882 /ORGANISM="Pyramimonas amylifera, Strain CCMP720" /LENGTH=148 /DNA_ID=CAMNT_0041891345 /DNA_START=342 /DNA_END=788 /DNA_ORIENTATION=-